MQLYNGTLHEWSEVVKDFTPECGEITRGKTPGFLEVDPDTQGK